MTTTYSAIDPTRLRDACQAVLDVLVDAAQGAASWTPEESYVATARPGYGCDSITVWPELVTAINSGRNCEVLPAVSIRFALAVCMGSDVIEDEAWWLDRHYLLDRVWGVMGGLFKAASDKTLCGAIGVECDEVAINVTQRFDAGDLYVWEGTVQTTLPVALLGS